jgi:hypothetical protein
MYSSVFPPSFSARRCSDQIISNKVAPIAPSSTGQRVGAAVNFLAVQGLECAPLHVFRQLHKIDIAAEAALRFDPGAFIQARTQHPAQVS